MQAHLYMYCIHTERAHLYPVNEYYIHIFRKCLYSYTRIPGIVVDVFRAFIFLGKEYIR